MFDLLSIKDRVQYEMPESPLSYLKKFKNKANRSSSDVLIHIANSKVFLRIPKNKYKWWSPELILSFDDKLGKSQVNEMTGPNSSIFTFTVFLVFGAFLMLTFASMMFYSQYLMDKPYHTSFLVGALSIILFVGVMSVYSIGKQKAKEQVKMLKRIADEIMQS